MVMTASIYDQSSIDSELQQAQDLLRKVDDSLRPLSGRPSRQSFDDSDRFNDSNRSFGFGAAGRRSFGGAPGSTGPPQRFRSFRERDDDDAPSGPLANRLGARLSYGGGVAGMSGFGRRRGFADEDVGRQMYEDDNEPMMKRQRRSEGGAVSLNNRFTQQQTHIMFAGGRGPPIDDAPFYPEKPSLSSSVVMPTIETKSREEAIKEMESGEKKEQKTRNKRMFANMLGTLSAFTKDNKGRKNTEQEKKQREVEARLAKEKEEEKARIKHERAELLSQRREAQETIKLCQRKRAFKQIAEREEKHLRHLQNFIQTQAKPPIFYLPAKHTLRTLELHKQTQKRLEEQIEHRQMQLTRDLEQIERTAEERKNIPTGGGARREPRDQQLGTADTAVSRKRRRDKDDELESGEEEEESEGESSAGEEEEESADEHDDKPKATEKSNETEVKSEQQPTTDVTTKPDKNTTSTSADDQAETVTEAIVDGQPAADDALDASAKPTQLDTSSQQPTSETSKVTTDKEQAATKSGSESGSESGGDSGSGSESGSEDEKE